VKWEVAKVWVLLFSSKFEFQLSQVLAICSIAQNVLSFVCPMCKYNPLFVKMEFNDQGC
jgi:hypothetical protein